MGKYWVKLRSGQVKIRSSLDEGWVRWRLSQPKVGSGEVYTDERFGKF